jgi:hydroxycarboxylate dehydrogenase B
VLIRSDELERLVRDIFHADGCSAQESASIARYLVNANLAGHDSHGVLRTPRYLEWKREGVLVPGQHLAVLADGDTFALVDGCHGFGQTVAPEAVRLGIAKATEHGVAVIALRRSGHLGRVGEWAEMAAAEGLASVHFVNVAGSRLVAPFGGTERRLSTAPFAAGLPLDSGPPVILDFATSLVAEGKIMVAANGGPALPPGALVEPDGSLTSDPAAFYGAAGDASVRGGRIGTAAIRTMGDHKGSGLAIMCELLAGALTGSGCSGPGERPVSNGMLSVYFSLNTFGAEDVMAEAQRYVDWLRSCRPATPGGEVLMPGEPERRMRARRLAEGVPLPDGAWDALCTAARGRGLDPARYR